ncbi:MAG: hypothetical protein Q9181_003308 [Wetmoreana brouardii]
MSHYDATSGPQQQPTTDEIIDWHLEQSVYFGESGCTTSFPTAQFFKNNDEARIDVNVAVTDGCSASNDLLEDVMMHEDDWPETLRHAVADFTSEFDRVEGRAEYMQAHKPLLVETHNEVHCRLTAAGMTQGDIDRYSTTQAGLRQKISYLFDLENGISKPTQNVLSGHICYGSASDSRRAEVNLNTKGSLGEFETCVEVYLKSLKDPFTKLEEIYYEDRKWKYRLRPVVVSKEVRDRFVQLVTQRDYEIMIREVLRCGGDLLLTQEDWLDPPETGVGEGSEEDQENETYQPSPQGVDTLFDDMDLYRDLERYGKGDLKSADQAELDELAAAARVLAEEEEAMEVSRARHDQARVAHDAARRAQRAESQVREDEHGRGHQNRAIRLGSAAGQAGSPLRRSQRVANRAPRDRPPGSPKNTTPLMGTLASRRGRGIAGSMSPPSSHTRSRTRRR